MRELVGCREEKYAERVRLPTFSRRSLGSFLSSGRWSLPSTFSSPFLSFPLTRDCTAFPEILAHPHPQMPQIKKHELKKKDKEELLKQVCV